MKLTTLLISTALLTTLSCAAEELYKVSTSIYDHGELIASPVLVVEAGKTATVREDDKFSYQLTITPEQNDRAKLVTVLTLNGETLQPELLVAYGQEASIEIGNRKLRLLVDKHAG
ncbi:hypothetical protein [Rheinheimera sp.]|uniref:hypothetical protein n=1 Tax=Rheinheimera sp. TaxID=1869214 RepID=UPI00307DBA7C